ncbi:hypothetical protein F5144DRAFT_113523 [Chaetomium tenue]|uniref:Uncharacterized protein n=1 Tax=Chaetomium tenue TaxID=1854479 RepID=A0ACB7PKB6_9PEZI|nr:hypothetical protein F5144DRAFT_113523 [Chaetomium globosum]
MSPFISRVPTQSQPPPRSRQQALTVPPASHKPHRHPPRLQSPRHAPRPVSRSQRPPPYPPTANWTLSPRTKLAAAGHDDTKARPFIPQKEGHPWRKLGLAREVPDTAPPGFAELRGEMEVQDVKGDDLAVALYVAVADERVFWWSSPGVREI